MTRDELIEAGYVALIGVRVEDDLGADPKGDAIEAILNAVEPLIRADERERITGNVTAEWAEAVHDYRADLRAKVKALKIRGVTGRFDDRDGAVPTELVSIADVLALLDGSN